MRLEYRGGGRVGRPPPKSPTRQAFLGQPETLRIIRETFDRRPAPIPEHEQRARERVGVEHLPADPREPVDPLAKILRLHRDQDPHLRRELNHASTPAIARASRASSGTPTYGSRTRTVLRGPSTSITQPSAGRTTGRNSTNSEHAPVSLESS